MSIQDQEDFIDDDDIICESCGQTCSLFDLSFNVRAEQRDSEFNYCEACWQQLKFELHGGEL